MSKDRDYVRNEIRYVRVTLQPAPLRFVIKHVDKYGFPRTGARGERIVKGFQTGDIVKAVVTKGKKIGTYVGRVTVRASGYFNIKTKNRTIQGISYRYCQRLHAVDGYTYHH